MDERFPGGAESVRQGLRRAFLVFPCAAGLLIALVDSSPGWDDTGVTAAMILAASALFGAVRPDRAAASALLVGIGVPLLEIGAGRDSGSLLAIVFAFAGAFAGALIRRIGGPLPEGSPGEPRKSR